MEGSSLSLACGRTGEGRDLWDLDVSILGKLLLQLDQRITLDLVPRSTPQHLERICTDEPKATARAMGKR